MSKFCDRDFGVDSLVDKIRADRAFLSFELTPPLGGDTSAFCAKIKSALGESLDSRNVLQKNGDSQAISTNAPQRSTPQKNALDKAEISKNALQKKATLPNATQVKTLSDTIDAFVCTDSPLARFKPSSILSSIKLQNALDKPLICTLSMRDRNSMALCGEILGANELGLRAFLSLTGDPIKLGDCAESKGVFEENSLKLARIIRDLNSGIALNGKPLASPVSKIYNFAVINSYSNNPTSLATKIKRKLANAPICAFFTQPIFARQSAEFLLEALESAKREVARGSAQEGVSQEREANCQTNKDTQIIFGFFPVLSFRVAVFLRDKLPGVYIPQEWLEKLEGASAKGKDYEREVGLELSRRVWEDLHNLCNSAPKIHFMSSNHIELLREFL
ncbi:methylenetetrahydrofolate reductase [Helicobacter sp. MIT 01-3238]|uniref:methylenetetrahydrofolate reductase n=1 Tax=Helicobacter sp. MIT 01-3238 TaxID=398627 RepID=UPI000E1F8A39|nr:methylenetetrahydrofolate reductase [Helicobacter sp. MIT 01-3238]RDU53627.1 5,10-methylenetetrahydrofolate reductase [Helicobacter sp. MIT 01-3238]